MMKCSIDSEASVGVAGRRTHLTRDGNGNAFDHIEEKLRATPTTWRFVARSSAVSVHPRNTSISRAGLFSEACTPLHSHNDLCSPHQKMTEDQSLELRGRPEKRKLSGRTLRRNTLHLFTWIALRSGVMGLLQFFFLSFTRRFHLSD